MDVIIFNEERGWNIRKAKLYGAFIGNEEGLGARYNRSFAEETDLLLSHQDFLRKETFTSKTTNYVSGEGGVFTSYQAKEIQNFPPIDKGMNSPSSPLSADEGHCSFLQSRNTPKRVVMVLMQSPRAFDMCTRTSLIQEA